ncbi:MAG: hypothetical protein WCD89_02455 [Anaerocolumna sp.]
MRVIIKRIINLEQGYNVAFSSEYGNATAIWNGAEPQINKEYFVEIEVSGVLLWQKDISVTDIECKIEEMDNGVVYLSGVLESIEDDGYTVIKIGDSIVAIETQGVPPVINSCIKLVAKNIALYEVNY